MPRLLALIAMLALAACAQPLPAKPALWSVADAHGARGFLFGTVHALPRPALWRTERVDRALARSDRIVVEVAGLDDATAIARRFEQLGHTPGQPTLSQRLPPSLRPRLDAALAKAGMRDDQFTDTETWAAALILARAQDEAQGAQNGIDRAVMAAAAGRPVTELEGAGPQLAIFDRLPEPNQRALLRAVVTDAGAADEGPTAAQAWRSGDMALIERETTRGLLADPGLRAALLTRRNQAWATRIAAMLTAGARPFVAVGAAHMAGPQGLPALLAAKGYRVTRIE